MYTRKTYSRLKYFFIAFRNLFIIKCIGFLKQNEQIKKNIYIKNFFCLSALSLSIDSTLFKIHYFNLLFEIDFFKKKYAKKN